MCRFLGGRMFPVLLGKHKDTIVGSYEYACCLSHSSCPTLCNPWTVAHQAPLSKGFSRQKHLCLPSHFSCVRLCVILLTVACQAPLSMDFPGKNNGAGCHFLLQGIFLTQGSNLCLLLWQAGSLQLSHLGKKLPSCL